jgi:hypothetical protein
MNCMTCFLNSQALTASLLLSVSKQAVIAESVRDHRFALRMLGGMSRKISIVPAPNAIKTRDSNGVGSCAARGDKSR